MLKQQGMNGKEGDGEMKKLYGLVGDDGEIWEAYNTLAELNGREYIELVENYTWEESDYTDHVTQVNYISVERLSAAFDALCDRTGMKKSALAKVCGKHITTFSRYFSGLTPVPQLVWEKVKEFER